MSTLTNSQVQSANYTPGDGGTLHEIVDQLARETLGKKLGNVSKDELEKVRNTFYNAAVDLLGKTGTISLDSVRNHAQAQDQESNALTSRDQFEKSAGVQNAPRSGATAQDEGYLRPGATGELGNQEQAGSGPIATGQQPQAPTEENFQPWASDENNTQGTETDSTFAGQRKGSESAITQGGESPGQEQVDSPKSGSATPESKNKRGSAENQSDYLAPGTMDEKKKKQDNPNHQENNAKEGEAGGKGSGSKNEAAPKSDHEMLGEQGSKIGADAVPNYPKNFSEAKDQVKQQLATKAADYIFDAVLEWVWTDLGIITIGVIGTFLLLLGHMFKVQLRPWQKWLIILYDVAVVGIIVFFVLPAGVVGTCLIDSSGFEICEQIGL